MNKIKFSHDYFKLYGQREACLVACVEIQAENITKALRYYDAAYDGGLYPLPESGKMIHLVFVGELGIPFSTIRRYTESKFTYYRALLGQKFILELEEKEMRE